MSYGHRDCSLIARGWVPMDTDAVCWVCSTGITSGERVTRLPSLGIDVHAHCAQSILRNELSRRDDDGPPEDSDEDEAAA